MSSYAANVMNNTKPPIDPMELRPLMYWAGLTLHSCQVFEYGVKVLLMAMAETGFGKTSLPEAIAIIENQNKKTLGQLLCLLRQRVTISDGWSDALESGLDARNKVIHGFLVDNAERIIDPDGRAQVLSELKILRKSVLKGDQAVREMVGTLCAYAGFDFAEMTFRLHEEVRVLNLTR